MPYVAVLVFFQPATGGYNPVPGGIPTVHTHFRLWRTLIKSWVASGVRLGRHTKMCTIGGPLGSRLGTAEILLLYLSSYTFCYVCTLLFPVVINPLFFLQLARFSSSDDPPLAVGLNHPCIRLLNAIVFWWRFVFFSPFFFSFILK